MSADLHAIKEHVLEIWKEVEKTMWIENPDSTMEPWMKKGAQIALQFCKQDGIRIGHVIALQRNRGQSSEEIQIRRVLGFTNQGSSLFFFEKSDAFSGIHKTSQDLLLGRIVGMKKQGKEIPFKKPLKRILDLIFVVYGWLSGAFFALLKKKLIK